MIPNKKYFLENQHRCTELHIKKHFPELYEKLNKNIPHSEALYQFYYGQPNCCPICGKPTVYKGFRKGYTTFCSTACSNKSTATKQKYMDTCQRKYGVSNPTKLPDIQNKIKYTNLERYGVTSAIQSQFFKDKSKATNIERYGVDHVMKLPEFRSKYIETCQQRYGVDYASQTQEFRAQVSATRRQKNKDCIDWLVGYTENGDWICKCPHVGCNQCKEKTYITNHTIQWDRTKNKSEICTILNPIGSEYRGISNISKIFFQTIDPNNIGSKEHRIGCYKVDWIYKNIIIEFYGNYWHANPTFYGPDWINPTNHKIAKDIWTYDIHRMEYLTELGYDVYVVWESDFIDNSPIINDIIKVISQIQNEPESDMDC